MNAPRRLADALQRRRDEDAQQFFTQGVVTAFAATTVTVDITGDLSTWPKLAGYSPTAGDVVWLAGPPGSWVCLGTVAGTQAAGTVVGEEVASTFRATGNAYRSGPYDGAIRWGTDGALDIVTRDGSLFRGVRSTNFATVAPSWRGVKRDHRKVRDRFGKPAAELIAGWDVGTWSYDPAEVPEMDPDEVHVGPMLDEMPELLIERGEDPNGRPWAAWSRDGVLGLALAAIQEQAAQIAELTTRVAVLERNKPR